MSDLQDIREMTVYTLATDADCGSPTSATSAGAAFLSAVRDDFLERFDYAVGEHQGTPTAEDVRRAADVIRDDARTEIADGAVPVYTYQRWETFTDLGAWEQDIEELTDGSQSLTDLAGIALYMIADHLVGSLAESLDEWADELEQSEGEDEVLDEWATEDDEGFRPATDHEVATFQAGRHLAVSEVRETENGLLVRD